MGGSLCLSKKVTFWWPFSTGCEGCVAKRKFCGTSFFTLNSKNESSMWNFRSVLGMQKPAHTTWMELSAEVFQFR